MDYQGNYFTDEPDEPTPKPLRIIKGIFKWSMYGISFIIYALLFYIIFANRDSKILEKNYMHQITGFNECINEQSELYRINTPKFMNEDGSIQLHNIDYSDEFGILELGIKYNSNKHSSDDTNNCLKYVLTDSTGQEYTFANTLTEKRGRYVFERICFIGLDIDLNSNELRYDYESKPDRTVTQYKLKIYKNDSNEPLEEFVIYDNSITFNRTEYIKGEN